MALAKNLQRKRGRGTFKLPKLSKKFIWPILFLTLLLGGYGLVNLMKVVPSSKEKSEIKLETGDRPLPQKKKLWVVAEGGLYLRAEANAKAKILILIPNRTTLEAEETQGEWYRVSYMNKTGWVNRGFVTTEAPAEDPAKDYKTLIEKGSGFSIRYPKDWVYQNYGENPASGAIAFFAFGPQLPPQLDPNNLPPIILRISSKEFGVILAQYKSLGAVEEDASVSGLAAKKFIYNASTGVQMTAYVVAKGGSVYILEETGGYSDELELMVKDLTLT
jgi:hypothetical protein